MAFELFLGKLGEFVFSKLAEKTTDKALDDLNNMKEFELILKTLQKNLKSLSAKAADVEEEIKNAEVSGRKKRKREVGEWLEQVKSIEVEVDELGREAERGGFIMRLMDGGKATRLNEQVEKLVQQGVSFGQLLLDVCGTRGEILPTNGMVGHAVNKDLEGILKLLENRQASRIGVYGMGGVGKTTLAKYIHNRLLQHLQGHVFWVTVSQEFTIKSLQEKIARHLDLDLSDEDEEAIRAGRLNRYLSQIKNSVLILDDVWENIDMLKVGCTFSLECCRLIITTRSLEVCRRIGCTVVIQVVKLRRDEAWKLFIETLGNEMKPSPQVEEIARSMALMCDGLPLAIVTVAGSMKGETGIYTWRSALAELKDCVGGGQDEMGEVDELFKVLKYSFDRLNKNYQRDSHEFNRFQHCFLYCSLYPEDYEIHRDELVGKFISEGLVDGRRSRRAQFEQGHSILDKLVNLCLLESCVDSKNYECVKMHDLVRSMALRICKGRYMVRAGEKSLKKISKEEEWTEDLEKVSLVECGIKRTSEAISLDCPKLSTLLMWGNQRLEAIPESFFSKMQGLCTLDLCWNIKIKILPDSISDLTNLKSLLLEGCGKLESVPSLGKLKAMRELNLSYTAIKESPQGLEELAKLEFLSLWDAGKLTTLPRGLLLKLVHLQCVSVPFHIHLPVEEIQNLKVLEEFNGGLASVEDFNTFMRSRRRERDTWYLIIVGGQHEHEEDVSLINSLRYKKNLGLLGCNLEEERVLGGDVEFVMIRECEGLSISFLEGFSGIKRLEISLCGGIEWILRRDGDGSQIFSTLEKINLFGLDDLKGVMVMERGIGAAPTLMQPSVFSSLRSLTIFKCNKVMKLVKVSGVPNLEVINITSCKEILAIFEEEEEDEGRGAASILTLHKLKELSLCNLPILKRVSKVTIISNSIQDISITRCPRLMNKLPLYLGEPVPITLRRIEVEREWWESLEWDINPDLPLLVLLRPFLHFQNRQ